MFADTKNTLILVFIDTKNSQKLVFSDIIYNFVTSIHIKTRDVMAELEIESLRSLMLVLPLPR